MILDYPLLENPLTTLLVSYLQRAVTLLAVKTCNGLL
jgi:hypothetical protein